MRSATAVRADRRRPSGGRRCPFMANLTAISMRYGGLPTQRAGAEVVGGPRHLDFLRSARGCSEAPRIPGFWTLDLFGIPWILSSEMSLFNGLRARRAIFIFRGRLSLSLRRKGRQASVRRSAGRARDHGGRRRGSPVQHWDQPNAAFAFLQAIVDSTPFCTRFWRAPACCDSTADVVDRVAAPRQERYLTASAYRRPPGASAACRTLIKAR